MCGICGLVGAVDLSGLGRMAESLVHRGPDDKGFFHNGSVALGVCRLSIIDVPGGHQPIANEDGSVIVVFNGEIYNHHELRDRLEGQGHRFRTRMFAFALWDNTRHRLFLIRDRLGIKPLY